MSETTVYADIVKFARNDDGDLIVVGKATGPDLDLDKQICDPEWLSKAMPEWMSTGGNLREQHSAVAAGVATELSQDGDSWMVAGLIVDPVSARKVEKGVLKGYSIGVKNPQVIKDKAAPGGRVVGGSVVEVSLVDRPCNPTCTLTLAKAAKTATEPELVKVEELHEEPASMVTPKDLAERLGKAANAAQDAPADPVAEPATTPSSSEGSETMDVTVKGDMSDELVKKLLDGLQERSQAAVKAAMPPIEPGGKPRYPITDVASLKDAIQAFGRAKDSDKAKVKAHIEAEAKRLGATNLIPDAWKAVLVKDARVDEASITGILGGLADCMKAELDELVAGDDERWDLAPLFRTVGAFTSLWAAEASVTGSASEFVGLTVTPDNTTTTEPSSVTENRLTDLVKSAVTSALVPSEERIAALETQLEKALALPEPGGPVITRTATQAAMAREADTTQMHTAITELLKKAAAASDPVLRRGYTDRAEALKQKIA